MFNIEMHTASSLGCCFPHAESCKESAFHVIESLGDNEGHYTGYSFCHKHWEMIENYFEYHSQNSTKDI